MLNSIFELPNLSTQHHISDELRVSPTAQPSQIRVIAYGGAQFRDEQVEDVADIEHFLNKAPVVWIDVERLGTLEVLQWLKDKFNLNPIHLNSTWQTHLYPHYKHTPHYHVATYPQYELTDTPTIKNLTLLRGANFFLTLHDQPLAIIEQTQELIRHDEHAIQSKNVDYLEYVLAKLAVQTYANLAEYYQTALQDFADNPYKENLPRYWQVVHQVQRLSYEFPWMTRDMVDDSADKNHWDALDTMMSNLNDRFTALHQRGIALGQAYDQKIQVEQLLLLQRIAGIIGLGFVAIFIALVVL